MAGHGFDAHRMYHSPELLFNASKRLPGRNGHGKGCGVPMVFLWFSIVFFFFFK